MKAKKVLKKLTKVEELLSNVADRYAAGDHVVHGFLDSAIASVVNAKKTLDTAASDGAAKKPPVKAAKTGKATGVRKGNATAKRKPNGADTGRPLSRTA
jgi:hypothetical protein